MKSNSKITLNLEEIKYYFTKIFSDKRRLGRTIIILIILIVALLIRLNNINKSEDKIELSELNDTEKTSIEMYVDISGEVNKPGVYMVEDGTRLYEVISKAGGLTKDANTDQINQAGYVEDGEKIVIPSLNDDELDGMEISDSSIQKTVESKSVGKININTASKDELMTITGIGEVIASRIIEYRSSNRFKSTEDIMNVKGIGNATFEKLKSEITV